MTWLINEAAALKTNVSGLTVTDANAPSGRPVEVRFREPETELADQVYPLILLEFSNIRKADEREHRSGPIFLDYVPEGQPNTGLTVRDPISGAYVPWDENSDLPGPYKVYDYPLPYDVDFQITVFTRFQSHLMQLVGALAQPNRIPARFGWIQVPQDGTIRSLFLMGGPEIVASKDSNGKRLFEAIYSVRVATELLSSEVSTIVNYVETINLHLKTIGAVERMGLDSVGLTDSVSVKLA